MLNPALYAVVAANSPPGRSSTAQGLFGAAGTVGFIVASLLAGVLAESTSSTRSTSSAAVPAGRRSVLGLIDRARPAVLAAARAPRLTEPGSAPYQSAARGGAAAARRAHNPKVTGSNPVPATKPPSPEPRARPPGVLPCPRQGPGTTLPVGWPVSPAAWRSPATLVASARRRPWLRGPRSSPPARDQGPGPGSR